MTSIKLAEYMPNLSLKTTKKIMSKEMEDQNKWREIPCSYVQRLSIVKIIIVIVTTVTKASTVIHEFKCQSYLILGNVTLLFWMKNLNTKEILKVTQIFELLRTILRQELQIHVHFF